MSNENLREYCLVARIKRTEESLKNTKRLDIEDGKVILYPLSPEAIQQIRSEIRFEVTREVDIKVRAESLEQAKCKATEILQGCVGVVVESVGVEGGWA